MEDNKMGQLGFKIDTGELATSTIPGRILQHRRSYIKSNYNGPPKYHPSDDIFR